MPPNPQVSLLYIPFLLLTRESVVIPPTPPRCVCLSQTRKTRHTCRGTASSRSWYHHGAFMDSRGSFSAFSHSGVYQHVHYCCLLLSTYSSARDRGCATHPTSMYLLTLSLKYEIYFLRGCCCSRCFHSAFMESRGASSVFFTYDHDTGYCCCFLLHQHARRHDRRLAAACSSCVLDL